MKVDGKWEGKLLDVSGPEALLILDLKSTGSKINGDFSVYFFTPGEGGCCAPVKRLAQTGPVAGKIDDKSGSIKFQYEVNINLQPIAVSFEATMMDADPHASQALIGSYNIDKGGDTLTLEGGSCVLWQFADFIVKPKRKEVKNG